MVQPSSFSLRSLINRQLRGYLVTFHDPVAIKDAQLNYQYVNAAYAQLLQEPQPKAFLGHSDAELTALQASLREYFHERDSQVLSSLEPYESVLLLQVRGQIHGYWHRRRPLLNDAYQAVGVALTAKALGHLDWMPSLDKQIDIHSLGKTSSYALLDKYKRLNENELIVLFFLLRLGSFSAIASYSGFSLPKVYAHMRGLYRKLNCDTKKELIRTALDEGYWFRIPKALFARHCPSSQKTLPWPNHARIVLPPAP